MLDEPDPMTLEQPRKVRRTSILVGAGVAAVVAAVIAVSVIGSTHFTPEKAAEDYLAALADGDTTTLAELAAGIDDDASIELLTKEVYEAATDRPSGYTIDDVTVRDDKAVVTVTADDGVGGEWFLQLEEGDKKFGIFQEWDIDKGLTSWLRIWVDADEIAVNGVTVDGPDGDYGSFAILPGTYTVDLYPGSEWLKDVVREVSASSGDDPLPVIASPQPSQAFTDKVDDKVGAWLEECLSSTEPEPEGCPQSIYTSGHVRNLVWELTESPTVGYDHIGTLFPITLVASNGQASASYESYRSGEKKWVKENDECPVYFSIEVDVVGDDLEVTADTY